MPARKALDHLDCAVTNTVDTVGDRWTLLILRDAFFGVRRFDDFQRDLHIARNVLADRLEKLVTRGLLMTRRYRDNPPRHEYLLTDKGKDLFDVLMALWRWGDRWEPSGAERVAIHTECGHETHLVATCAHCGERLSRQSIRVEPGLAVVEQRRAAAQAAG
jgi:DNA-binding HxlR family transcriptional regulator